MDTVVTNEDTAVILNILTNDSDLKCSFDFNYRPRSCQRYFKPQCQGQLVYTPNANFNGTDTFTYKANDGQLDSNVATVAITVNPTNDAPTAVNDTVVTNEDTAVILNILTNDSDPENAPLTSTIVQGPAMVL